MEEPAVAAGTAPQVVYGHAAGGAIGLAVLAVVFVGVSVGLLIALHTHPRLQADPVAHVLIGGFFIVGFFLTGLHAAWAAVASFLRLARFGRSVILLESGTGMPGRPLILRLGCGVPSAGGPVFEASLTCVETWTEGTGKSGTTESVTHWRAQADVLGEEVAGKPRCSTVPLRFDLPAEALPAGKGPRGTVAWTLSICCEGCGWEDQFPIPVERSAPQRAVADPPHPPAPVLDRPPPTRVAVTRDGALLRLRFPRAMHPSLAAVGTSFLIVSASMTLAAAEEQFILLTLLPGLLALLLLVICVRAWFMATVLEIERASVRIRKDILGIGWERIGTVTSPAAVSIAVATRSGTRCWWRLQLVLEGERGPSGVGSQVRSHREALYLRDLLRVHLGGVAAPADAIENETSPRL